MRRQSALMLAVMLVATSALAEDKPKRLNVVPGEKLDSGLGELTRPEPPEAPVVRSGRINPVPGEKLDSGLGAIVTARR